MNDGIYDREIMLTSGEQVAGQYVTGDLYRLPGGRVVHTFEDDNGQVCQDPDRHVEKTATDFCPYCSSQGQETPAEQGQDAQHVELDVGNTALLCGALCKGCREAIGAETIRVPE